MGYCIRLHSGFVTRINYIKKRLRIIPIRKNLVPALPLTVAPKEEQLREEEPAEAGEKGHFCIIWNDGNTFQANPIPN